MGASIADALPAWTAAVRDARVADDEAGVRLAIELSARNVAEGTGRPFGSVVVDPADGGRVVGVGVNRVVPLRNVLLHAETVAVADAQRTLAAETLAGRGLTLYTSCSPCMMCLGAIYWGGVARLVGGATAADVASLGLDGGPTASPDYRFDEHGLEIVEGVLREQATAVLRAGIERDGDL